MLPRVLAQHEVRLAKLLEHAQRDVAEVADRRGADRERHLSHAVDRLEADERGPDQPRALPELDRLDTQRSSAGWIASRRATSRAGSRISSPAAAPKPPPIRTTSGSNMFTNEPIAAPSKRPMRGERSTARAPRRPPHARRAVRIGLGAVQLARDARRPHARRRRLEVPAPVAVALARRPVELDDHVPELGPATVQLPVEHEPAADPRPERQHHSRRAPRPAPERHSASAAALPSFSTPTGRPKRSTPSRADRRPRAGCSSPGATRRSRGRDCTARRARSAAGDRPGAPPPLSRSRRGSPPPRTSGSRARRFSRSCRPAPRQPGEDLRPADIHPDHPVSAHGAATISARMPADEKPYRLLPRRTGEGTGPSPRHTPRQGWRRRAAPPVAPPTRAERRRRWGRVDRRSQRQLLVLLAIVWGVAGYFSFSQRRR